MCYLQVFSSNKDFLYRVGNIYRKFKSVQIYRKIFVMIFNGWNRRKIRNILVIQLILKYSA